MDKKQLHDACTKMTIDAIFDEAVRQEKAKKAPRPKRGHSVTRLPVGVIEPERPDFLLAMKRKKLLGIYVSSNAGSSKGLAIQL